MSLHVSSVLIQTAFNRTLTRQLYRNPDVDLDSKPEATEEEVEHMMHFKMNMYKMFIRLFQFIVFVKSLGIQTVVEVVRSIS